MLMKEIKEKTTNRYTIFFYWIGRISKIKKTTMQNNLQIQCSPNQITKGIFHRTRTKNLNLYRDTKDPK